MLTCFSYTSAKWGQLVVVLCSIHHEGPVFLNHNSIGLIHLCQITEVKINKKCIFIDDVIDENIPSNIVTK